MNKYRCLPPLTETNTLKWSKSALPLNQIRPKPPAMAQYQRKELAISSKNHHGDLISTPPKKTAAQKFRPAGPIRAVDTNRTTRINFRR